ncbi:MAG TPA: methyltransferase domain-containing protein [Candidatus Dormibacteraeota bacterium]
MRAEVDRRTILGYYDSGGVRWDYSFFLGSGGMHFGYSKNPGERLTPFQLRRSARAMTAEVADRARIMPGERVLDAGCGVGWPAISLARTRSCNVTGISISAAQVRDATATARKRGLAPSQTERGWAEFAVADYTATGFPAATFDVAYFLDSACHDEGSGKAPSMREAFRVLKPGGRLVVADGFAASSTFSSREQALMDSWLDGWAVEQLAEPGPFERSLADIGFDNVAGHDSTEHVLPFARALHDLALLMLPGEWLLRRLGVRSEIDHRNLVAARDQYRSIRQGLWRYFIFTAMKPGGAG